MKLSKFGINLIKHFEGLRLEAYQCPANKWTIGYGHTFLVNPGDVIDEKQADNLLKRDVLESEIAVRRLVKVPLKQYQFDALVSFIFNVGIGNFKSSTLLRKINSGNFIDAAEEFSRWINAGGKKTPGLISRREHERLMFLGKNNE